MTTGLRNNSTKRTAFSDWLRANPGLDSKQQGLCITDVDYLVHKYMVNGSREMQYAMLIEEKCAMAWPQPEQLDTLYLMDTAWKALNGKRIQTPDGKVRRVIYHGLHILQLENLSPTDGLIYWWTMRGSAWDKIILTPEALTRILRFEKVNNP